VFGNAQQNRTDVQPSLKASKNLLQNAIKNFRGTQKYFADKGLVRDDETEDLLYCDLKNLFTPLGLRYKRIRRNVTVKCHGEYDIVADDKGRVLVIAKSEII
jgi:hypothetical protein